MALDGECTVRKFTMIGSSSIVAVNDSILPNPNNGCCDDPILNVLADSSGKKIQNDVNTPFWAFEKTVTAATIKMYKLVNSAWVLQATIFDNTYGTYGAFGYYTNSLGQKFISLRISWAAVLAAKGAGMFKFTCEYIDGINGNGSIDSYKYCLKEYSAYEAEGTIRLEYWLSGVTEDIFDDTKIKDLGTLVIYNTIRIIGFFGYPKSAYKSEYIEYQNGQSQFVEDRREPTYEMEIKFAPEFIHAIVRTDFMMADQLAVTDYNSRNNASYVTKYLIKDSEYSPEYYRLQSNNAPVSLKFKPQNNRSRKFRV